MYAHTAVMLFKLLHLGWPKNLMFVKFKMNFKQGGPIISYKLNRLENCKINYIDWKYIRIKKVGKQILHKDHFITKLFKHII